MSGARIRGEVRAYDQQGMLLENSMGKTLSKRIESTKAEDKFTALVQDGGGAQVTVGIDEKMGGPYGYSSVQINVSVTLICDQTVAAIEAAKQLALDECLVFVEDHFGTTHHMLCDHLERYYNREDREQ